MSITINNKLILKCPKCKENTLQVSNDSILFCDSCKINYKCLNDNLIDFLSSIDVSEQKKNIQSFWGDLSKQWYSDFDKDLDKEKLSLALESLRDLFIKRKHLAVTEMNLADIHDKLVLEIGSGGGGHSSLFKKNGANMVSLDITPERAMSTARKFSFIDEGTGLVTLADAENLPFNNNSFDIVYSNGVLHHSENTEKCIQEVFRVLKPGGKAIIMLYSKSSAYFWLSLLPLGLMMGGFFRFPEAEWLGRITEGKPKFGSTKNPITRVYYKKQIEALFKNFTLISLRKHSFFLDHLGLVGYFFRIVNLLFRKPHPGGLIVYGKTPFFPETKLEHFLSPYLGWCWNIVAKKE